MQDGVEVLNSWVGLLGNVSRDQLGHLEHADRLLTVEYRLELLVCVDLSLLLGILKVVSLDVDPELLGELCAGERFCPNNRREGCVRSNRFHECCVGFAFSHNGLWV